MRVLVLTNQFADICGSELVALEVATWFAEAGDRVTLASNLLGEPIRSTVPPAIELVDDIEALPLGEFDLVWCQHDLLALLGRSAFEEAAKTNRIPHVVYVSLSPYEPYESVDAAMVDALSGELFANSEETRRALVTRGHGLFVAEAIRVFHNAAPALFWNGHAGTAPRLPQRPRALAFVSHHPPAEIDEAVSRVEAAGVKTWRIGQAHDYRRVAPEHLHQVDGIVSIGKSAVYALATATPVYLYDRFGGSGWLTRANFEANAEHNFSGRPWCSRRQPEEIANELLSGQRAASEEMLELRRSRDLERFELGYHLAPLRERVAASRGSTARATKLQTALASPRFRAHADASRAKHQVMRRAIRPVASP